MGKSFLQLLSEAPLPPPPPPSGGGLGASPSLGSLPPPPPPSLGGGGLGLGLGGPSLGGGPSMGGGGEGQPLPIKTVDVMDVWKILREAIKDMDKHEELNIKYKNKIKKEQPKIIQKNSSLIY